MVRAARRPPGWRAPGPPPAAPADRPDLLPGPGEDLCFLAGDWRILQLVRGHRWSLDDLVTAWFACELRTGRPPRRFADLGCGIGTVLMLVAWRFPQARGTGVEAQAGSVALARRSLAWNGAEVRCDVRHGDLREPALLAEATFDLVTGTPPYLPAGSASESARPQVDPCHVERRGGVEHYCAAAARGLAPGGLFVTCTGAGQAARVCRGAAAAGLAVLRRRDVVPRAGKGALLSVWALAHAREGLAGTIVEPPLVVRDASGRWSEEFRALRQSMGMPA